MKPKVEACMRLVKNGIEKAVIVNLTEIDKAVKGVAGTQFHP
jgi:carbamate kinase